MQRNAYLAAKGKALNYYRLETILHLVWPRCSSLLTARLAWIINCHQHAYRHTLNTFLTGCIHKKYCIIQLGVVEIRPIESGTWAASGSQHRHGSRGSPSGPFLCTVAAPEPSGGLMFPSRTKDRCSAAWTRSGGSPSSVPRVIPEPSAYAAVTHRVLQM